MTYKTKILDAIQHRRKLIAIFIIVILIISILGVVTTSSFLDEEDELIAIALADTDFVRSGEVINFNSEDSKGNIESLIWNFTDGNETNEPNPSHSFEVPGTHRVLLTIYGSEGKKANNSIVVEIQHLDEDVETNRGRYVGIYPWTWGGPGSSIIIGPNAGNPTVNIRVEVDRPVGTFWFRVAYYIDRYADNAEYHIIYSENVTLTGGSHVFEHTVEPTDLKDEVSNCGSADLYASVLVFDGKMQGCTFYLSTTYPMNSPVNDV